MLKLFLLGVGYKIADADFKLKKRVFRLSNILTVRMGESNIT